MMTNTRIVGKFRVVPIIVILLMLAGCYKQISYREHEEQVQACIEHDMTPYNLVRRQGWYYEKVVIKVICKDNSENSWDATDVLGEQ